MDTTLRVEAEVEDMEERLGQDVIARWPKNPLIAIEDLDFRASDVMNAGFTVHNDQSLLLITVQGLEGLCRLYLASSDDGKHFRIQPRPFMSSVKVGPAAIHESFGIRDPRITKIDDTYYIVYVADGDHGLRLGLARTKDFKDVERMGYISEVDTRNGALFPRRINGRYTLVMRPDEGSSIWLIYSDDLTYWGDGTVVMIPRHGYWDPDRIGAAGPPIEIDQGWLLIYYGEKYTSAGPLIRLGAAILDRNDPSHVISRSNIPILSPRERYERIGDVPNIVFSCGHRLDEDGTLHLYYGASDSCIALGQAHVEEIIQTCIESEREF
ncbi:MAG: glycoside hydrolase family 130 protein [Planctomycetota bacterium]